jgi:hypothetical protein
MNILGRLHYQHDFKDLRVIARMSNKQGQALLDKALSGVAFAPAPTTPVTSATHVPYVDLLDSDTEEPTQKKTPKKKVKKPIVVSDSESDASDDIVVPPIKKARALREEGATAKVQKGGRSTTAKGKEVVLETDSDSEGLVETQV